MIRMSRLFVIILSLFVLFFLFGASPVQSQTSQQTLNQYISDLQKNPSDYALREKIIKHVQTMRPAPAIPEEARRHYVMALTLFKGAKKVEDYSESIEEFRSALQVAPWWAEANRDLGMALEAAKRYDEAMIALKLYIATGPGEEKARAAQDEIYKIEGMKKLAAKENVESSPKTVAVQKQNTFDDLLRKIDGRRYTCPSVDNQGVTYLMVLDVTGKVFRWGTIFPQNYGVPSMRGYVEYFRDEIRGRETTVPTNEHAPYQTVWAVSRTYVVSVRYTDGDVREYIFLWQR